MTLEERKYLQQIADDLPLIELSAPKVIYTQKLGHHLTKKDIAWIVENAKLEKEWQPQPNRKYTTIKAIQKYHDHFTPLAAAWKKDKKAGIDAYILAAKNLANNLIKISNGSH
jgi:hypothetical protein